MAINFSDKKIKEPEDNMRYAEKKAVRIMNNGLNNQMDAGKLVPLLTAALQEAIVKIETLETQVRALQSS